MAYTFANAVQTDEGANEWGVGTSAPGSAGEQETKVFFGRHQCRS